MIMDKVYGFIGTGMMGVPICRNILKNGHNLKIYNRTENKIPEDLKKYSVNSIESLVEKSDIIFMIVTDSKASGEIVEKILSIKGKVKAIIDMSTISQEQSIKNFEFSRDKSIKYCDCPVIGSVPAAESGKLTCVFGGDSEIFEEIRTVLQCFSAQQIYMGENGKGIAMKLLNNLLMGTIVSAVSEIVNAGMELKLDFNNMVKALQGGGARTASLELKGENMKNMDFTPQFLLSHQLKDLRYGNEMLTKNGLSHVFSSISESFYSNMEANYGNLDMSAIFKFFKVINSR
ncbi:NAD(P)-dependent oxidoreductase [Caldiplasma sukawensis]